ncbi:GNAT family N-acetyltransferase [Siminovitchia sp. 179-K 8D1 HS]|uniref:GNAT family N-acetyltransferase n=1 Tax=Siminovitchia sp. 179-K 8D1 HS TaxID=3142385 RepID=UPI0039A0CEE4
MARLFNQTITIKEMEESEREAVRKLLLECYRQFESVFEPERWSEYVMELIASIDHPDREILLIAKQGEEIVGTLQLFSSSEKAYKDWEIQIQSPIIRFLGVHPRARGLGVGTELLRSAMSCVKELGASSVFLHTTDSMEQAVRLYEQFGFIRDPCHDIHKENRRIKCYRFDL